MILSRPETLRKGMMRGLTVSVVLLKPPCPVAGYGPGFRGRTGFSRICFTLLGFYNSKKFILGRL